MRCWQAGAFNTKVLDHVKQLVQEFQQSQLQQELKIYVTGNAAALHTCLHYALSRGPGRLSGKDLSQRCHAYSGFHDNRGV